MIPQTLAVVDDEPRMAQVTSMMLQRVGYEVQTFTDPRDFVASTCLFDLVLTDLKMPHLSGLDLLAHLQASSPWTQVILMTAHGSIETALEALKQGAFDYVQKPFHNEDLQAIIARALRVSGLHRENLQLREQLRTQDNLHRLVAHDPAFLKVLQVAKRAANSTATVLLSGESGTGKEVLAKFTHFHSPRASMPFVAVNCKALASGVLESELFGHKKGAFTGAHNDRKGLFVQASGGTLFLDELGELDLDIQAKLLRVLQERVVRPVGADQTIAIDTRIVCATNRDLLAMIQEGQFREDLYYRLAVIPLEIPPLRERPGDILPLAKAALARITAELDREVTGWSDDVAAFLMGHKWPGNVRELENLMERAVVLASGQRLELGDFMFHKVPASVQMEPVLDPKQEMQSFLDQCMVQKIKHTLAHCEGRRGEAAALLGMERSTLYRTMRRLGIG